MSKQSELAAAILQKVGGKDNITNLYHCMTRLRFALKDNSSVNREELKAVKGVLGVQDAEGELQVVIGTTVDSVCTEIAKQAGITAGQPSTENLDAPAEPQKKKITPKYIGTAILNAISACMSPLVPLFIVVGLANVVAAVIGPTMLNLVTEDSALYTNFYYVGQAMIYALPILTAITAARHFKADQMLALGLACIMLYPDLLTALAADGGYTIFGITAPNVTYSGQIIPIILTVWIQSYVERLLKKIVPDVVKVMLVPFGTIVIMLPLMLCLLGPAGNALGNLITSAVLGLFQIAGPVETALICALLPFLTAFGIGRPLFFACMAVLFAEGVEYSYMPYALCVTNFVVMGCCTGYLLKAKTAEKRQNGITCLVANFLGGVSEPTLFGIILPNPQTFLPLLVGGAISGLFMGIMKVGSYQFGTSNFLSVLTFVNPEGGSNFLLGCVGAGIGYVATCILMLLLYKDKETK